MTLTDRELAMDILHRNLNLNLASCKHKCPYCSWSDLFSNSANTSVNPCMGLKSTSVTVLDWGNNLDRFQSYDVILAADIVYLEETFPALLSTFKHLSSVNTTIFLSCKIRYTRDKRFLRMMRESFKLELLESLPDKSIFLYKARLKPQ